MTREEFEEYQAHYQKERLKRYHRLFNTEDGKWVLEDLKSKTIYNTSASTKWAKDNNPLGAMHLTGQRDLVAWIMQLLLADTQPQQEGVPDV